jgi:hypothetical protein
MLRHFLKMGGSSGKKGHLFKQAKAARSPEMAQNPQRVISFLPKIVITEARPSMTNETKQFGNTT